MEFEGRIQRVLPVRSGTSSRGEWKTMPFVFEYFENAEQRWSDKVLLETFDTNIMAQIGAYLKKGQDGKAIVENGSYTMLAEVKCKCGFSHNVREYEGKVFNDVRLYKFEVMPAGNTVGTEAQQQNAPQPQSPAYQPQQPQAPLPPQTENNDDLPF
jgi:hypothetical protein